MPNTPSAARHLRKSIKQQARNQAYRTRMRNTIKQARQALTDGDTTASKLVHDACREIDKTATKGIIKKNTASRYKSRLMTHLNNLPTV
mgnify:CR=1 FL=1